MSGDIHAYICARIMCIDYPGIVVLYSQKIHSKHMVNADFMLGQRRRRLTYINPTLAILQRKHNRSTPAQCYLNGEPASQTMDQRQTNLVSVYAD